MKIRNGFVSNSSSSSFFIVSPKEAHDKALKKLHPYYQKWINDIVQPQEAKICGNKVVVVSWHYYSDSQEPMKWNEEYPPEAEECYYNEIVKMVDESNMLGIYTNALKKETEDIINITIQG